MRAVILLLAAVAGACAAPPSPRVTDSPLAAAPISADVEAERQGGKPFSKLSNALTDHFRDSLSGLAFAVQALSRRVAEDQARTLDAFR